MAADLPSEVPGQVQRWTAWRRVALMIRILKGETTVVEAARKHGFTGSQLEDSRHRFLAFVEDSRCRNPRNDEALQNEMVPPQPLDVWIQPPKRSI
ncbi:MAG: hypothetical protein ICCCNLDF_03582 [Planctomycetes bacterium]|nr:hypothetical protein [Planctomycetota bacterium]